MDKKIVEVYSFELRQRAKEGVENKDKLLKV